MMELQIAVAATAGQVGAFFNRLRGRGFYITQERSKTGELRAVKEYRDKISGEYRARITLRATFNGEEYVYRLYVETHAHDSVTGESVAEGNSLETQTTHHKSIYREVMFLDSVLTMPECAGYSGES